MKRNILILLLAAFVIFIGCEGDEGPPGIDGEDGDIGDIGYPVNLIGGLDSVDDLPEVGDVDEKGKADAYWINGNVYMWNPEHPDAVRGWVNLGRMKGPKGPQGEEGEEGQPGGNGEGIALVTVTYEIGNGTYCTTGYAAKSSIGPETILAGGKLKKPIIPVKTIFDDPRPGLYRDSAVYVLEGWEVAGGDGLWNFDMPVNQNMHLRARWTAPTAVNISGLAGDNIVQQAVNSFSNNYINNLESTLFLNTDLSIPFVSGTADSALAAKCIKLTIMGIGRHRTINSTIGQIFNMQRIEGASAYNLTLDNITLNGGDYENGPLVLVGPNSTLTVRENAKIINNNLTRVLNFQNGPTMVGGVTVTSNSLGTGTLHLYGEVSGHKVTLSGNASYPNYSGGYYVGGVLVDGASYFYMYPGAKINNNTVTINISGDFQPLSIAGGLLRNSYTQDTSPYSSFSITGGEINGNAVTNYKKSNESSGIAMNKGAAGGVFVRGGRNASITGLDVSNNTIASNESSYLYDFNAGGLLFICENAVGSVTFQDITATNNTCSTNSSDISAGGIVFINNTKTNDGGNFNANRFLIMRNVVATGNNGTTVLNGVEYAGTNSGGISIVNLNSTTLENIVVTNNRGGTAASSSGSDPRAVGGIIVTGQQLTLNGGTISGNSGLRGGIVFTGGNYVSSTSSPRMTNVSITGNTSTGNSGSVIPVAGLTVNGGADAYPAILTNVTITGNIRQTYERGYAIGMYSSGAVELSNTTIKDNINNFNGTLPDVATRGVIILKGTSSIGILELRYQSVKVASGWTGSVTLINFSNSNTGNITPSNVRDNYYNANPANITIPVILPDTGYVLTAADIAKFLGLGSFISVGYTPGTSSASGYRIINSGVNIGKLELAQ